MSGTVTDDVDELFVLLPGRDVTLSTGRVVRVMPLSFARGLEAHALPGAADFLADLRKTTANGKDLMAVFQVAGRHPDWLSAFTAHVTGLTVADVDALKYGDGVGLAMGALNENRSFFEVAIVVR